MGKLILEIITPDGKAYSNEVDSVVLPGTEGELGIFPGHVPILTSLKPGEIKVNRDGHREELAVDKGFARVVGDHVSVLTEAAIQVEAIDITAVEEAHQRAQKALQEAKDHPQMDPAEIERLEAVCRFSIVQRLAKQKKL